MGRGVKCPQTVYLVAKQFDAYRLGQVRRKDIDQPTATAKGTGDFDHRLAAIAIGHPVLQRPLQIDRLALAVLAQPQAKLPDRERVVGKGPG